MFNERQGEELYILAKHPCISSGISERDLQTMYLSEEESGYNANICYAYLVDYITRAKCEHINFFGAGHAGDFFRMICTTNIPNRSPRRSPRNGGMRCCPVF